MDTRHNAPRFRLVVKAGAAAGQVFELSQDVVLIGRSRQSDLVVEEPELSRQHARLVRQGEGYLLEDLDSTNGTFVNGVRLTAPQRLQPGDEIRFGPKTVMVYEPVVFDAEATVAVDRPAPARAMPFEAPPTRPAQRVVGQVPPAPPAAVATPAEQSKNRHWLLVGCLVMLLLAACFIAGVLWYIDVNYLWCTVFPFLAGCP